MQQSDLYQARDFRQIELWKDVTESQWYDWKWQMKNSIRDVETFSKVIELNETQKMMISETVEKLRKQNKDTLRITPYYATLMHKNPFALPHIESERTHKRIDPIFWQAVPTPANLLFENTGIECAMSEHRRSYGSAYQRYPNRVALFVAENTSCSSYCIHCQRTKSLDSSQKITIEDIEKGIFYISKNTNIEEVLVTGGDALMISRKLLKYILEKLSAIPHLRIIRIATRTIVTLPMIITHDLLELIKSSANKHSGKFPKFVYFMTHINHWQEITTETAAAVRKILDWGFPVRNQTVLLNHVNNYFFTLAKTFRMMTWIGVQPYYLLQCHKEKGLAHFIVPLQIGKYFIHHLQGWISGIMRPIYAANLEGGKGKILIMPQQVHPRELPHPLSPEEIIEHSLSSKVYTWDGNVFDNYEALGRATVEEYQYAQDVMTTFFGQEGIFKPYLILIDKDNNIVGLSRQIKVPKLNTEIKSKYFNYNFKLNGQPVTNPADLKDFLDREFYRQKFAETHKFPLSETQNLLTKIDNPAC